MIEYGLAQTAFAGDFPDGVNGHQPDHVHAQGFDARQITHHFAKSPLRAVCAREYLIDDQVAIGRWLCSLPWLPLSAWINYSGESHGALEAFRKKTLS